MFRCLRSALRWLAIVGFLVPAASAGCGDDEQAIACPALHVLQGGTLPGAGREHRASSFTADQLWTARDSPHLVKDLIVVTGNRSLTLQPCAVVVMEPQTGIQLGSAESSGDLVAVGSAGAPILITGAKQTPGAWDGLAFHRTSRKSMLAHVTVEYAGGSNDAASLYVSSHNELVEPTLVLDHVTVRKGAGDGVVLENMGELAAGSDALTVSGMSGFPLRSGAIAARSLPPGSYTGNGDDRILIVAEGAVVPAAAREVDWKNLGLPYLYRVGTYQNWLVSWTLAPGLEIFVQNDLELAPDDNGIIGFACGGKIIADGGDVAGTITFRGEGGRSWGGFKMQLGGAGCDTPAGISQLSFVKLLDAGTQDSCDNDLMCPGLNTCAAAIIVEGDYLQLRNSEIHGISGQMYAIARHYCGEGGEGLAAKGLGNSFFGPMHCPQSDQNECDPPGGACDPKTSCCLHDLACHGEVL